METINIKCKGHTSINVSELKPFQGNLKDLSESNYNKLKGEILRLGFSEPVSVWIHSGISYVINGHQRVRTIGRMIEEGYSCDDLPCNLIEAKDKKEAKQKILALTSQYGNMTTDGLYEFLSESGIDVAEIEDNFNFPEIDAALFKKNFFDDLSPDAKEAREIDDKFKLEHECPKCGYEW